MSDPQAEAQMDVIMLAAHHRRDREYGRQLQVCIISSPPSRPTCYLRGLLEDSLASRD
jgi:hypothetical protein